MFPNERGASSVVGIVLLVAVAVVIGSVTVALALTLVPDQQPGTASQAAFDFDRTGGDLAVQPLNIPEDTQFELRINENPAYTWTDTSTRRLSCLNPGDRIDIVSTDTDTGRSHLLKSREVQTATECSLSGTTTRFTYAKVGEKQVPLTDQDYEFTLAIDPNGPTQTEGDTDYPTTNPWNYVQRYDRSVEGLDAPVYVVVFADNAPWDTEPTAEEREQMADTFHVTESGDLVTTPDNFEPTNDVYTIFKPGCDQSTFRYVGRSASYDNQILLDGEELFVDSNATAGTDYGAPGVECS